MNNDINYKKVINLFNYFIKIIVKYDYKPWNMGTNQISSCFDDIVKNIKFKTKGYLELEYQNTKNLQIRLFFVTNKNKIPLLKNKYYKPSTIRQKLQALYYSGLINYFSESKTISDHKKWQKKIKFNWENINEKKYNGLDLFYYALKNEKLKNIKLNNEKKLWCFSFLLCCFVEILKKDDNKIISLINLENSRFFENIYLRGTKKNNNKALHLLGFIKDEKNSFPKIYKNFLNKYEETGFIKLMQELVKSLDFSNHYNIKEIKKTIDYKTQADKIISNLYKSSEGSYLLRKNQNALKQRAIYERKNSTPKRTKDDLGIYDWSKTHKIELAHIKSIKKTNKEIEKFHQKKEWRKVCDLYEESNKMGNLLLLPVCYHRDLDHGEITIYKDGSIYNYLNQKLDIKLEYIPPNSFLPNKT